MELETYWESEAADENDKDIAKLEADILEDKAILKSLSYGEEEHLFI